MFEIKQKAKMTERALLIGTFTEAANEAHAQSLLEELEELAGITVADREEIILDIFGARAQTREARIQVDLARMQYSLPRLTRAWSHLGQQGGGIGAKGEGESPIAQDKRKIRLQIDRLKRELVAVRSSRAT